MTRKDRSGGASGVLCATLPSCRSVGKQTMIVVAVQGPPGGSFSQSSKMLGVLLNDGAGSEVVAGAVDAVSERTCHDHNSGCTSDSLSLERLEREKIVL